MTTLSIASRWILAVLSGVMICSHSGIAAEPQTGARRLALGGLSSPGDGPEVQRKAQQFLDLLAARVSKLPSIHLLEREEVQRILSELEMAGTSGVAKTIRAGELLRADWMLLGNWLRDGNTNIIAARLVETRSGVIVDFFTLSFGDTELEAAVATVADFVRAVPANAIAPDSWTLLGIGGFENLGLNDQYPDLRKHLRMALEQAFRGSSIRTVERAMVSPLLQEFRLSQAGITKGGVMATNAAAAAFLLDGVYQSIYQQRATIDLVLRLERVGGARRIMSLKGAPGDDLHRQVVSAIKTSLAELKIASAASGASAEAEAQMLRGKQRSWLPAALIVNVPLGAYPPYREREKRLQNITEAIEAFESVLLLQPENTEAKLYLAACYLDPFIQKRDSGRDYLREIIASDRPVSIALQLVHGGAETQSVQLLARWKLAETFADEDDAIALAMFLKLVDEFVAKPEAVLFRDMAWDCMEDLSRNGKMSPLELAAFQTAALSKSCEFEARKLADGGHFDHAWLSPYITRVERALDFDRTAADAYLRTNLLPTLRSKWPQLEPLIDGALFVWADKPPSDAIMRFRAAFDPSVRSELRPLQPAQCSKEFLNTALNAALRQGHYDVVEKIGAFIRSQSDSPDAFVSIHIAYAARQQGKWKEALAAFEEVRKVTTAVTMKVDGPWGRALNSSVVPDKLIAECRLKLGQSVAESEIGTISLASPIMKFPSPFVMASDGPRLWIGNGIVPCVYHKAAGEIVPLDTTVLNEYPITAICVGKNRVWFGTANGLLEYQPDAGTWQRFTEKDGLLLPRITALAEDSNRLWIGYGKVDVGAIGYLDLSTRRFGGFDQQFDIRKLADDLRTLRPSSYERREAAPRNRVIGLAVPKPGEVWVGVVFQGLLRYTASSNAWKFMPGISHSALWCVAGDSNYVACGALGHSGGLVCNDLRTNGFVTPQLKADMPNNLVASIAIDGEDLWVGGLGWLAVLNAKTGAVRKSVILSNKELISEILESDTIRALQIDDDSVWVAAGHQLHRIRKSPPHQTARK